MINDVRQKIGGSLAFIFMWNVFGPGETLLRQKGLFIVAVVRHLHLLFIL